CPDVCPCLLIYNSRTISRISPFWMSSPMRLLLALDGSEVSMDAADFLTRLPWPVGTEVTVVSVIVDTAMGEIDAEVWMSAREAAHRGAVAHFQRVSSQL